MNVLHFLYPFFCWQIFGLFPIWSDCKLGVIAKKAIMDILVTRLLLWPCDLIFLGYTCRSRTVRSSLKYSCQKRSLICIKKGLYAQLSVYRKQRIEEKVKPPLESNDILYDNCPALQQVSVMQKNMWEGLRGRGERVVLVWIPRIVRVIISKCNVWS